MIRFICLILLNLSLFATDFDCIVIGSSPFSLFEALYQSNSGRRVLILEESDRCGGAWKGIDACGIKNADLGCHMIGHDIRLKTFLETYAGCHIISMDDPKVPFDPNKGQNGWYFSHGCYELIDHLIKLLETTDALLLTNTRAESATVDQTHKMVSVQTENGSYTAGKLIVTPQISLCMNPTNGGHQLGRSKHYHLYLLIQDATPPRFSYHSGVIQGATRMMNLTHFVDLIGTGRQFIVIQTHNEQNLTNSQMFLEGLKKNNLVDEGAYILDSDTYIYESGSFYQGHLGGNDIVEIMQTGHILNLSNYISKWEMALKPYDCR